MKFFVIPGMTKLYFLYSLGFCEQIGDIDSW